jgi:hypothetical protein
MSNPASLVNPTFDNHLVECLVAGKCLELSKDKDIVDMKFDGTLTVDQAAGDVAIALGRYGRQQRYLESR